VLLPHHHIGLLPPSPVMMAEAAVRIAVRMGDPILLPQQLQRHVAVPLQLLMQAIKIRKILLLVDLPWTRRILE
jgi:hypothetical protein